MKKIHQKWHIHRDADYWFVIASGGDIIARVPIDEQGKEIANLIASSPKMHKALIEISEGKGRYSLDPLQHCSNTVEDMKQLAFEAL